MNKKVSKAEKDFKPIIIYLVLSFLAPAWLGVIYGIITMGKLDNIEKFSYIATIIAEAAIFVVFMILYNKKLNTEIKRLSKKEFGFIILAAIGIIILNEAMSYLATSLNIEMENQDMIVSMFDSYKIVTAISVGIFAPVIEELVFRYSIGTLIKDNKIFLIISSIIFGLAHGIGIATIIYVIIGLLLGLIYLKSNKNIISSITVHMLNNIFSVILILLSI